MQDAQQGSRFLPDESVVSLTQLHEQGAPCLVVAAPAQLIEIVGANACLKAACVGNKHLPR